MYFDNIVTNKLISRAIDSRCNLELGLSFLKIYKGCNNKGSNKSNFKKRIYSDKNRKPIVDYMSKFK